VNREVAFFVGIRRTKAAQGMFSLDNALRERIHLKMQRIANAVFNDFGRFS
jgi:hypothetical protein